MRLRPFRQKVARPVSKQTVIWDKPPSARGVALMMVRPAPSRTREQAAYLDQLIQSDETIAVVFRLAQDFGHLSRKREGQGRLEQWKAAVLASGIAELIGFVDGLADDAEAVANGCTESWSNGMVEGFINKVKWIKRSSYGQAGFPLLQRRVRLASNFPIAQESGVKAMMTDGVVKEAGNTGKGVFALRGFAKGEFLFRRRYKRIIAHREISQLSEEDQRHVCELDGKTCAILLAPGCYLNHACDPNAMRKGVKVYAWKDIQQGDEITIDYRLNAFTGERWDGLCGSANCQGYVVSSYFSLSEDQQRLYLPYAPKFIQDEYHHRQKVSPSR